MDAMACHNCLSNFKYFVRLSQPRKRQLEPFLVIPNTYKGNKTHRHLWQIPRCPTVPDVKQTEKHHSYFALRWKISPGRVPSCRYPHYPKVTKGQFNARMGEIEKQQLTAQGNVVWATLEKATHNRHTAMKSLLDHVKEYAGKGCVKIVTSASSFIVIVYKTPQNSDKDLKRMAKI
jgi:hypothetical protein